MHCVFHYLNGGVEKWCHHLAEHSTVNAWGFHLEAEDCHQELSWPVQCGQVMVETREAPSWEAWRASQEHPFHFTKEWKDRTVLLGPSNLQEESNARFQPQLSWGESKGALQPCWAVFWDCRAKGQYLGKETAWTVWNEDQRQEGMPMHKL